MSVILCKELFPGRKGSDGIERKLKHTRIFEVLTDDPLDDDYIAGAGDGVTIPRNGDIHPSDPFAVMIAISADQDDELPTRWIVVCEYSTEIPTAQAREAGGYDAGGASQAGGQGGSAGSPGNPLARDDDPTTRPTKWSVVTEEIQRIARVCLPLWTPDIFDGTLPWGLGVKIQNSATREYIPPPMMEYACDIVTAVKNYAIGDPLLSLSSRRNYRNHINQDAWYGYDARTLRLASMDVDYTIDNGIPIGVITYRFKERPWLYDEDNNIVDGGWDLWLLDAGFYDIGTAPLDEPEGSGRPATEPVLLDGSGARLPAGGDPVHLRFGIYDTADFVDLRL